jgi:ADP-ribose pyrophosphatase YjhB (NUDIX family)
MLRDVAKSIWRSTPRFVRVWGVRLSNARFTVSAAGIIMNSSGRVLLLKHRFRGGSGWGIPGGFIEAALRRELREEIGLELPSAELIRVRTLKNLRQIEIIFYAETEAAVKTLSDEIEESGWFTADSLPEGVPTDQVQMIKAVFNRRAKPER